MDNYQRIIRSDFVQLSFTNGIAILENYQHRLLFVVAVGVDQGMYPYLIDAVNNSYGIRIGNSETGQRHAFLYYI